MQLFREAQTKATIIQANTCRTNSRCLATKTHATISLVARGPAEEDPKEEGWQRTRERRHTKIKPTSTDFVSKTCINP